MVTRTTRIKDWLAIAHQQLSGLAEQPTLEAQVLLAHILSQPRAWVIAHPEVSISRQQDLLLNTLLQKRLQGEPLPYLLGHWEFYGLDFLVNPSVLIPRPETELLVEEALAWIRRRKNPIQGIDVGTGCGCIAISLAKCVPGLLFLATDISRPALNMCAMNAARHGVQDRLSLAQADLLEPFSGPFNLVCANLPYIPSGKLAALEVSRHEPRFSLDGGPDGLHEIELLLEQVAPRLAPVSLLLLEIESGQGRQALDLARRRFPSASIRVLPDLAGWPRLLRVETGPEGSLE
jgi:release factor glutamine methyltransferase